MPHYFHFRSLHRAHHRQAVGCRAAETQQKASDSWLEFCRLASGEWEGSSATFDTSGQPQELPPHYVPEAYREWGQAIYNWQVILWMLSSICVLHAQQAAASPNALLPTVDEATERSERSSLRSHTPTFHKSRELKSAANSSPALTDHMAGPTKLASRQSRASTLKRAFGQMRYRSVVYRRRAAHWQRKVSCCRK